MSETDGFIDEVTEEVRRDRLFALYRRYGWIGAVVIVLLVGGAAYNEWQQARASAAAQALGDAMTAALQVDDVEARRAALLAIDADGATGAVVRLLAADTDAAGAEVLSAISADTSLPEVYRDMALIKLMLADNGATPPADRIEMLAPLTAAGRPFRPLAQELTALAEAESGNKEAAIAIAREVLVEGEASEGLRRRLSQLIVALGGTRDGN